MADTVMNWIRRQHVLSIPISMLRPCSALVSRRGFPPALRRQMMTIARKSAVTASTSPACVGSLAPHIDKFAEFLAGEGYASGTVTTKYALVVDLSHWLKRRELPVAKLDEARLKQARRCIHRPSAVSAFAPSRSRSCVITKGRPERSGSAHTRLREIPKFGARPRARDIDQLSAHRAKILDRTFREQGTAPSGS